jgi:hypothetical protein
MRKLLPVFLAVVLCSLSGCIVSLHPIYTDADVIFEPALLGTWSEAGSKETWRFEKADSLTYSVTSTDEQGKIGNFEGRLAKVKGTTFLDLYPVLPETSYNDVYLWHLLPAHTFTVVESVTSNLTITDVDFNWLKEYLARNPGEIRHEIVDGKVVFTAGTAELQAFAVKHLQTAGAYEKPTVLERVLVK